MYIYHFTEVCHLLLILVNWFIASLSTSSINKEQLSLSLLYRMHYDKDFFRGEQRQYIHHSGLLRLFFFCVFFLLNSKTSYNTGGCPKLNMF